MSQSHQTFPNGTDNGSCYSRLETVAEDSESKHTPPPISPVTCTFDEAQQSYGGSDSKNCSLETSKSDNIDINTAQSPSPILSEVNISDIHSSTKTANNKDSGSSKEPRRKMSLQPWIFRRQSAAIPADPPPEEFPAPAQPSDSWHRKLSLPPLARNSTAFTSPPEIGGKSLNVSKALQHFKRVVFSSISNVSSSQTEGCEREGPSSQHSGLSMADIHHSDDLSINNGFVSCDDEDDLQESRPIPPEIRVKEHSRSTWESMIVVMSAMYCKLLVVFGLALPMSEFISKDIPPLFFHGFYLYLYGMSVAFLLFVYTFLLRDSVNTNEFGSSLHVNKWNTIRVSRSLGKILRLDTLTSRSEVDLEMGSQVSRIPQRRPYMVFVANYGSFYLRSGAVLFGIGSMIYSGLEIGQYFDISHTCQRVVMALTPALKLVFTFIQMYFVFLNASMSINKHKILGRFGLMHMVATNLCTWLNVVIEETKHELDHLLSTHHHDSEGHAHEVMSDHVTTNAPPANDRLLWHGHKIDSSSSDLSMYNNSHGGIAETDHSSAAAAATHLGTLVADCGRDSIMGKLVNSVSPFLFPFSIEYSLICAATLYVMWKHLNKLNTLYVQHDLGGDRARKHHYSVDCARFESYLPPFGSCFNKAKFLI